MWLTGMYSNKKLLYMPMRCAKRSYIADAIRCTRKVPTGTTCPTLVTMFNDCPVTPMPCSAVLDSTGRQGYRARTSIR